MTIHRIITKGGQLMPQPRGATEPMENFAALCPDVVTGWNKHVEMTTTPIEADEQIDKTILVGAEFKAKTSKKKGVLLTLDGYASTNDIDSYNDIVEPGAFLETMTEYMAFPILLRGHDWWGLPIGKVVSWSIDDYGLKIKAEIMDTVDGRDVATLVNNGVLKSFSIGFRILKSEVDEEDEDSPNIRVITKLRLFEISVVNVPANAMALIESAKELGIQIETKAAPIEEPHNQRSRTMGVDKTLEKQVGDVLKAAGFDEKVDSLAGDITKMEELVTEQGRMFKSIQEKQDDMAKGRVTHAEFAEFAEKIGGVLEDTQKQLRTMKNARRITGERMPVGDWRQKAIDYNISFVNNDANQPLNAVEQRAHILFHAPIDLKTEEGQRLKQLREVHDIVVLTHAFHKGSRQNTYNIANLKSYKLFYSMVEEYDPEFAKAMYSTGSTVGDEWVPTEFSSQLWERYQLEQNLEGYIEHFQMPSNPSEWPIKTSNPQLYRAAEAAVDNPSELTKSNVGTSKITFNAETYAICLAVSPQWMEDSIIQVASTLTTAIAVGGATGYESLLLNGDTGTHMDSDSSFAWATDTSRPESYEKGFRSHSISGSQAFTVISSSAGVGDGTTAFVAADVRHIRKSLPNDFSHNPTELVYAMPLTAYLTMLNFTEVTQTGTYGLGGGFTTGTMPMWDGSPVVLSSQFPTTLHTDGTGGTAGTKTGIICFNKNAFKIGEKRGITVEFEKAIRTQQWSFVGSFRKSFQSMNGTTNPACAYGFGIAS